MAGDSGRAAPATDRQALAIAVLVTWIVVAAYLIAWADATGQLANDILTPWHLPAYLGIGAVVVYLLSLARRAVSQRHPRGLVPPEFAGSVIGAAMLVLYLPLDVIWASLAGLPEDISRTTAVPRLFFGVALVLLASGPIIEALRRAPARRFGAAALALVLAAGSVGATIAFFGGQFLTTTIESGLRPTVELIPGTEPRMELHRLAIDGSTNDVITTGPDLREPATSRDGSKIATVWWDQQRGDTRFTAELVVMRADGTGRRVLTNDNEWKGSPSWSPDGSKIVYTATAFGALPSQPEASFGPQQAPDPDGQAGPLIFSGPGGDWDIIVVDVASGATTTVVTGAGQEGRPSWSADGKSIAYYSTQAGSLDLWLLDVATNERRPLTEGAGEDWGASFSPDGRTVVFASNRDGDYRIYSLDVETRVVTRLTDGPNSDWLPAYSPDGQRIVFASDRNTKTELWSMSAEGFDVQRLTNTWDRFPEMTPGGWAPDSSAIYYTSRELFPDEGPDPDDRLAVASFALEGAIIGVVVGLLFAAGGTFPVGTTLAVLMAVGLAPASSLQPRWLIAALVGGLAVEIGAWLTRRRPPTTVRTAGLAALGAAAWSATYFITADQTGDLRWGFNLLATAVSLAALAALAAAAAIASGRRRSAAAE
jgi:TolB protein